MKTLLFSILMLSGALLFIQCEDDESPDRPGGLVERSITSDALQGNIFGDPVRRDIQVWLPRNYMRDGKSYPVFYYLHGQPLGENSLIAKSGWDWIGEHWIGTLFMQNGDFPEEGFEKWMSDLMDGPDIDEMIIVMPDATSRYGLSMYSNSPLHGDMEPYIAEELVKYIDSEFRTIPNREHRYIGGHCMGGYGAMRIAMKYPGVFGKVAALTPLIIDAEGMQGSIGALMMENPNGFEPHPAKFFTSAIMGFSAAWTPNPENQPYLVDLPFDPVTFEMYPEVLAQWESQSLFALLGAYGQALTQLDALYFDCGNQDELGFHLANVPLHQAMEAAGIPHTFTLYDGMHLNSLYSRLEHALRFLSDTGGEGTGG